MPFFLKPCFKIRKKKKKAIKKNSSTYFKSFYDKESPITSEAIHEGASTSFASIDRDERDIGLLTRLVLGSTESHTPNTEVKESRETENITTVPSPDRDIVDILSSAVEQLSEDNSSSDDNRYAILSSTCRQGEETDNTEFKGLLNESFDTSDDQSNDAKENPISVNFGKENVEDFVESESKTQEFIIASKLFENTLLTDESNAKLEGTAEVTEIMPAKECTVDVIVFVSTRQKITEVKPLLSLAILNRFIEQTVSPVSVNPSAEIIEYKYGEKACDELNVSISESSEISFTSSAKQSDSESESPLNSLELQPILTIADYVEENFESTMDRFLDTEQSLAVQKVLCANFCGSDLENPVQIFSTDNIKESFESGHFEITGASDQQITESKINSAESINHSTGDSSVDFLKRECIISENVLLNDKAFNEKLKTLEIVDRLNSTTFSDCCGDHSDNVNGSHSKKFTCRMAAALNDIPSNFSTNKMEGDSKIKSNFESCNTTHKRRRSRNALFSSLNISLSPDAVNREVSKTEQLYSEEIFEKESCKSPDQKSNSSTDVALQISELKTLCEKIEMEETAENVFKYKSKAKKIFENNNDENSNLNIKSMVNNIQSKNKSSFIHTTLNEKLPNTKYNNLDDKNRAKNTQNCSLKSRNYSFANEKVINSFEISNELEKETLHVIDNLLRFAQREVNLFYKNNELEPESFKNFIKEILFDYKFYKGTKRETILKKQLRFEIPDTNSIESNIKQTAPVEDSDFCNYKVNYPLIKVNEGYELSQQEYNTNCADMKFFFANSGSSNSDIRTCLSLENFCTKEEIEKEEESKIILAAEIGSNKEKLFHDLKTFQSFDESLAYEEQLKLQNKKKKSKPTLSPTNLNLENGNLSDDIDSEIFHNWDGNITCCQLTSDFQTVVSPLNDFKNVSFNDMSLLDEIEKEKLLEYPCFTSAGGDIGNNDLCMDETTFHGDEYFNAGWDNGKSEILAAPAKTNQSHLEEPKADKNSGQDSPNHFTIVLSPRNNSAAVNCSVNMTIGGDTSTCTSNLTSPISIEVTREDIRKNERFSIKTRQTGVKSSTEDITEKCGVHRACLFGSKELESKRLRNLELYETYKSEAKRPMGKQTRVIPIHPAESFEFTLSTLDNSVKKSRKSSHDAVKSKPHKVLTPHHARYKNVKPASEDANRYSSSKISSVHGLDIQQEKNSNDEIFRARLDSLKSPIFGTPERSKILNASKAIRSPKHSLKTEPSPSKGTRRQKTTPHKIGVNNPKLYFLDESSPEYKRGDKSRSQASDEYNRVLNSPFDKYRQRFLCTKLSSPPDLSLKFDQKFKRYARRGRNIGDLISYKRSTEWLRDAGIVGQVLTAEEADRAFKCAAGVKVALNKFDYRRFLYKLSRLNRLRYNEIYEKLTEAVNELN